ncbi:MAG TPA: acetylxylan esterase [Opitutaceae bacterium]|nr:acetylxylan esterase [Opitutaceae bacterium]
MKKVFSSAIPLAAFSLLLCADLARGQVKDVPNARPVAGIPVNDIEANVGHYTLPDVLTLSNGQPVKDAATWINQRRPEIVKFYETQVYGRIPPNAPKVTWEVASVDRNAMDGTAIQKQLVGHMGGPDGPAIHVTLYTPAHAAKPVPVLVAFQFGALPPRAGQAPANAAAPAGANAAAKAGEAPATPAAAARPAPRGAPIAQLLENGFGYATLAKGDIETDIEGPTLNPNINIARKLGLAPGQTAPAADEWGAIAAWAWGLSRVVDYFETDHDVDAKRVAITGGSRLGKTVLWAGVNDQRIAMVIACSSGEGGAALARRNYGETIAHLVAPTRYPYQFAANYQKYAAHPEDMPMDTHMLVAAMAPRPLLLHTAANGDNWSDPKGEYLAAIAATPAYQLLGKKGLDRTPQQEPVTSEFVGGDLAYYLNNGGHAALNWDIALQFMNAHLKAAK